MSEHTWCPAGCCEHGDQDNESGLAANLQSMALAKAVERLKAQLAAALEREAKHVALIARVVDELAHINAHGEECDRDRDCDVCEQTNDADEHCNCWLALKRDVLAALSQQPTATEKET